MNCGLEDIVIENIKKTRKQCGISQETLAEMCGTSASYICSMENHKYIPKLATIERIARALKVPAWSLFRPSASEYVKTDASAMMSKKEIRNKIVAAVDSILG